MFQHNTILGIVILLFTTSSAISGSHIRPTTIPIQSNTAVLSFDWVKPWGGGTDDAAHNIAADGSGNLYVIGEFSGTVDFDPSSGVSSATSHGGADVFLSKFTATGIFQWAKTWGGSGRDVPNGVAVDGLGHVYVSGPFQSSADFNPDPAITDMHSSNAGNANNIFLSEFDANGTLQWARTWGPADGGAESYSIAVDATNHVYVQGDFSGTTTNFNPWDAQHPDLHTNHAPYTGPAFDAFLSKFDASGNFMWARTWGGEGYDDGPGVAVDSMGNVYVAGMYASKTINFDPAGGSEGLNHPAHDSGMVVDVFLSKFDANGNFQWVRTWGGTGSDDAGETVIVDGLNNVYVAGRFASANCDFNPGGVANIHSSNGSLDAFVSKFDSSGSFQWAKTWGGAGWDAAGGLAVDAANNVYTTGMFNGTANLDPSSANGNRTSQGGRDVFFSEFSANGTFLMAKTWGGSSDDLGYHIIVDGANTVFVVGGFQASVDFDPASGVDTHTANGGLDVFFSKFLSVELTNATYLPLVVKNDSTTAIP